SMSCSVKSNAAEASIILIAPTPARSTLFPYTTLFRSGWWEGPQTFVLDYDEIGNVNHYQIRLKFNGAQISVEVTERTHDGDLRTDRKSTRLNSSHVAISYAVFCLKKKKSNQARISPTK